MALDPYGAFVSMVPDAQPLTGWRIAVKDMIAVKGMPQPAGIDARKSERARADAPVVARFKQAGHTVVGVTTTDAAGFGTMTADVVNPVHPTRAVGGSSGGSAAAIAAGMADIGLGTDTGGSVRIPAAYCDLYAFKPSRGRVPMEGVLPLSPSLDHVGVMTASPAILSDAAHILIEGERRTKPRSSLRIVATDEPNRVCARDVAEPFADLANLLNASTIEIPFDYELLSEAASRLICADAYEVHRSLWETDPDGFPPLAVAGLRLASCLDEEDVDFARATLDEAGRAWRHALEGVDVLISPTLPMRPTVRSAQSVEILGERWPITNANIRLCQFANVAGLPVVVAPIAGQSIQFIGRAGDDEALIADALTLAKRLERASLGWNHDEQEKPAQDLES